MFILLLSPNNTVQQGHEYIQYWTNFGFFLNEICSPISGHVKLLSAEFQASSMINNWDLIISELEHESCSTLAQHNLISPFIRGADQFIKKKQNPISGQPSLFLFVTSCFRFSSIVISKSHHPSFSFFYL